MKKHIPNLLTLGNLFCGTVATIFAVKSDFRIVAILVMIGVILDFFDGFVARLLKVQGELGKQLDSLADMVTSGVVPGIVMFQLIQNSVGVNSYLPYVALLLTLGAGYRLAVFNIDTRQSSSFIGVPTPAMNLFVVFLPLIISENRFESVTTLLTNPYVLVVISVLFCYLMNCSLELFSLKFKDYSFKKNMVKYLFLLVSLILLIALKIMALPLIICIYILISVLLKVFK